MRDENHLRRVGLAMTTPTPRTLQEVLRGGRQCDEEGVEIIMSREACCVAADTIDRLERDLAAAQERNTQLVKALDDMYGTPCEQIRHQQELQAAQEARQRAEAIAEGYRKALIHERTALSIVRERQCHEGVCTVSLADIEKGIALLDAAIDAAREGK